MATKIAYLGDSPQAPLPSNSVKKPYPAVPPTTLIIMNASNTNEVSIVNLGIQNGTSIVGVVPADQAPQTGPKK